MNNFKILTFKKARILSLIITLLILTAVITTQSAETASTLTLAMSTDKSEYHLRQKITITGNLTSDSSPIENALVAVEIKDPRNNPFYFRTIPIGNPSETWAINITDFSLKDLSENPLAKTTPNSEVKACVTIKNELLNPLDVTTAITICDENLIPLFSGWSSATLPGRESSTIKWVLQIPRWAKPGKALVFINAYTGLPENQGVPYTPERIDYFYIVRNLLLEPSYAQQQVSFNSSAGSYEVYLSAPPDRYTRPGTYMVHAVGRISPAVRIYNTASFSLNAYPCPPQAAFTYSPLEIYQNMTVTFDASSSSAEGFNDYITSYEWTINDPYDPRQFTTTSPTTSHAFEYAGTFIVELNVTDNEGLWSTTSKPVLVQPEFGPTANFTLNPIIGLVNQTITFDASTSELGWSAATQQFSPIVDYAWNFGDGTVNSTSDAIIFHKYIAEGNYSVTLTIEDAVGRTDLIMKTIEILNTTLKTCDVNGDGFIDVKDLLIAAFAYGSRPGDPNWEPRADINGDDFIDVKDILAIALNYGQDP